MKNKLKQLPTSSLVTLLLIAVLAGVYFYEKYHKLQLARQAETQATQDQLADQQRELDETKKLLEGLTGKSGEQPAQLDTGRTAEIQYWRARTASIKCTWPLSVLGEEIKGSGSGLWISSEGVVITANHVVARDDGLGNLFKASSCAVKLPGDEEVQVARTAISAWRNLDGVMALRIANPTAKMKQASSGTVCSKAPATGDPMLILGYPSIGSTADVTVTDGIISGTEKYEGENYYITSAKIEQGNSGGAAILVDKNCYLGMPVFVRLGELESLGRILDLRSIKP